MCLYVSELLIPFQVLEMIACHIDVLAYQVLALWDLVVYCILCCYFRACTVEFTKCNVEFTACTVEPGGLRDGASIALMFWCSRFGTPSLELNKNISTIGAYAQTVQN